MARSDTVTLLPMDRFFKVIGYHPLHANQVVLNNLAPATFCANPLLQHPWQDTDRIAREDIAQAIAAAEEMIARELGYFVAPKWVSNDVVRHPRVHAMVQLNHGYVISGGVRAAELIDDDVVVRYDDHDGDGYAETATIEVSTTVENEDEIALFYPNKDGAEAWRIRPITVLLNTTTDIATITCRREQLVRSEELDTFLPASINGTDDTKFLEFVDVYRVYNDPSTQVSFITNAINHCSVHGVCTTASQTGCMRTIDPRNGYIMAAPATWSVDDSAFVTASYALCRVPDRLAVSYRSGWPLVNGEMDPMWERAVAYLAMALANRDFCECKSIENQAKHWREDIAALTPTSSFRMSTGMLENPFGTTRGAIYAWRIVQQHRLGQAVTYA